MVNVELIEKLLDMKERLETDRELDMDIFDLAASWANTLGETIEKLSEQV